ncbi:glycosyltransferase family 8 protein [Sparassis crispa]|uniref:Glycosyltransferase family 8 protein n=1 Tax=Sparassis crispa TaxID=139825 RepID=A0A401GF47_9APHY|nr:glycosyltransferase family 8 protein [Sparassis crispa]GBE80761.1 glycosyltransferase family 8 protein [Sparassis crispa]
MFSFFRSYKDYTPLFPSDHPGAAKTGRRIYILLLFAALVASAVLNIVLGVKLRGRSPEPLDNYQNLNTQPIVSTDALNLLPQTNPNEHAIVTTLYTDAYATAIATLGHSLNKVNSTAARLLLYLPDRVSPHALCVATASGFMPRPISRIPPPNNGKGVHPRFLDQYSKLNLWTLDGAGGYASVVYLDADTLVLRNFDELFGLPYSFAAVPDVYYDERGFVVSFNAGVLFLRPSTTVFHAMLDEIATATYPMNEAEQAFLNHYYAAEAVRLPYAYNANLAIKIRQPALWTALLAREARIVHFTVIKPFLVTEEDGHTVIDMRHMEEHVQGRMRDQGGLFEEELGIWLGAWRETRHTYSEAFAQCSRAHPAAAVTTSAAA